MESPGNVNITTTIAEYSATTAALSTLKAGLAGKIYEVTNATGMALAKFDRRGLVTLRTDLEKTRKEIKAPALAHCKLIDDEAKRITMELLGLETPIDTQIKVEEARKEAEKAEIARIEAERVAGIQSRIDRIRNLPLMTVGFDSFSFQDFIAKVEAAPIGDEFMEFAETAASAKAEVVVVLNTALAALQEKEAEDAHIKAEREAEAVRLENIRVEQEKNAYVERLRLAGEQEERDRLQFIRDEEFKAEKAAHEAEQAELQKVRDAEAAQFAREKAAHEAERAESDRIAQAKRDEAEYLAAKERAEHQAVIDAERAKLKEQQDALAAEQLKRDTEAAELKRKQDEADLAAKALPSGYSIIIKNAGKSRFVGIWLNEKDVEQYRTGKAWETATEALAMVEKFMSCEGRV